MTEKNVVRPADMPSKEHWAVLVYGYVTVPGYDARDPNERKDVVEYIAFSTKEKLEAWVTLASQGYDRKSFSVIHAYPAKVSTTVSVSVS